MGKIREITNPSLAQGYSPNHCINTLIQRHGLKNDAALCRMLELAPPVLAKIRHHRMAITPAIQIVIHDKTGLTFPELRALMNAGDEVEKQAQEHLQRRYSVA